MARELVTNIWCDFCLASDSDEPVYTRGEELPAIAIGALKPRVLAACEPHRKEHFDPFDQIIRELGQVVSADGVTPVAKAKASGSTARHGIFPCPDPSCPKHDEPYTVATSLHGHVRGAHKMTLNELRAKFGQPVVEAVGRHAKADDESGEPAADAEQRSLPDTETVTVRRREPKQVQTTDAEIETLTCSECGKVYGPPKYQQPKKARAIHMSKVHGIRSEAKIAEEQRAAERAAAAKPTKKPAAKKAAAKKA